TTRGQLRRLIWLENTFLSLAAIGVGIALGLLLARLFLLGIDRKSTRLNSSPVKSSYAALCLTKKNHAAPRTPGRVEGGTPRVVFDLFARCRLREPVARVVRLLSVTATPPPCPLSLHDALPICTTRGQLRRLIWLENTFLSLAAIGVGIALGLLLARLFLLG